MSTPPLPTGLDDTPLHRVANRLHSASIHLLRRARVADLETGLSPERLSLLSVLVFAGPQRLGRLAEIEQVSRPAISRSVKALTRDGLVACRRDRRDRRVVTARATRRGRRLMEEGRRRRLELIAASLSGLADPELTLLAEAAEILERAGSAAEPKD